MKQLVSRILAGLLAVLIVGSTVGCNKGNNQPGGNGDYGRYDETVTFSTVYKTVTGANYPDGYSASKNPYWDYIYSELNVKPVFNWEASDYDAKLLLDIAGNQLPDIFMVYDYNTYLQLYQADMIEDLTDYYEEYASDKMKAYYSSYNNIFTYVTEDDSLMALPSTNNGYQHELLWIRKDWLDALGLQIPKTIDEIEKVALAFANQDPGGNGAGNTYGLLAYREHSFNGYRNSYGLEPIANALDAYPKQWMADDSGKVYYGSTTFQYKQVLSLVRSWIEKGVINDKVFDMGWEQVWSLATNGQAGMWFFPWNWAQSNPEFFEKNPRAELVCINAPERDDGKVNIMTGAPFEGALVVRKGYEHPEVVFKIWDLQMDIDGDILSEAYQALEPFRLANTTWYAYTPFGSWCCRDNETIPKNAAKLKIFIDSNGKTVPEDTTPQTLKNYKDILDNYQTTAKYKGAYISLYQACNIVKEDKCKFVDPVYFFTTASMIEYWTYLSSMENDTIRTILTGENSIDTFDAFVADWRESGGDDVIAEVQEIYDERMSK